MSPHPGPARIRSQAGISVSDQYDFEGSSDGIEEFEVRTIQGVHDFGPTLFSERLMGRIDRSVSSALLQNAEVDVDLGAFPSLPSRVYGFQVFVDTASRLTNLNINIAAERGTIREFPVWIWDGSGEQTVRLIDNGAAVGDVTLLTPTAPTQVQQFLLIGNGQPLEVANVEMRGLTSGFGAGTVTVTVLTFIAFPGTTSGALATFGSSLPSW